MRVAVLRTENVSKSYRGKKVVNSVSIQVAEGEIVGLLGPNGAGKTTTFYVIVGMIRPDGGRIYLDEEELTRHPMYQRARKGIGYLSQEPSVFRKLTVEENILGILQTMNLSKAEQAERLSDLMKELKITHLGRQVAGSLSGGERRRLEIARALTTDPHFLLLDEPFTGIDPIVRGDIQEIIRQLRAKGLGVLITDHNVRETLEITDKAYIIYEGKILLSGTATELIEDKKARELYLGPDFKM
ncbi:LPS export ABC transporter ATP-binding protein [candidate division TA06 bacterium]|uniref:LPS export ABC transporter ATP-binding protein n=1 Tax=candidate division TA06 bacterium TaxID=2250710 RepID=A0A523UMW9_UNCT6|nr:MAG: LPS export ABC transporter ATP-binding protein [candidate division TA06 bacterium]